jgi:hypothetical protein
MTEKVKDEKDEKSNGESEEDFNERRKAEAETQGLPEGAVPEQRPQAFLQPADPHSRVYNDLVEAEDARAGNSGDPNVGPRHTKADFDRASSKAQAKKSADESLGAQRLYPGARGWINNPDTPDHGRAIAINGVAEYENEVQEFVATLGTPASRFAKVKSYNAVTRDGRSEHMVVDAEHIQADVSGGAEWGKTPLLNRPV